MSKPSRFGIEHGESKTGSICDCHQTVWTSLPVQNLLCIKYTSFRHRPRVHRSEFFPSTWIAIVTQTTTRFFRDHDLLWGIAKFFVFTRQIDIVVNESNTGIVRTCFCKFTILIDLSSTTLFKLLRSESIAVIDLKVLYRDRYVPFPSGGTAAAIQIVGK